MRITYTNSSGVITSPNFPLNYNGDETILFIIKSKSNYVISLKFTDFETEDINGNRKLSDRLRVSAIVASNCNCNVKQIFSVPLLIMAITATTHKFL